MEGSSPAGRNDSSQSVLPAGQRIGAIDAADDHANMAVQAAALSGLNTPIDTLAADWLAHFCGRYAAASEVLQPWWVRLLAAEAAAPGTFSSEALERLSALDDADAVLLAAFCQFAWTQGEPTPLIYQVDHPIYTGQGIDLPALRHLRALGLISLEAGGYLKKGYGKHTRLFYHGRPTKIGFAGDANNQLELGHALLTDVGKQLALICGASRNQQFYEYVIEQWFRQGLVLSSLLVGR